MLFEVLERALSKVAFLIGVEFSYGTKFINSISKDASNTNDFMNDYDVNVLANGGKKSIGESFGFQAFDENTVHIDLLEFDESNLEKSSFAVKFPLCLVDLLRMANILFYCRTSYFSMIIYLLDKFYQYKCFIHRIFSPPPRHPPPNFDFAI